MFIHFNDTYTLYHYVPCIITTAAAAAADSACIDTVMLLLLLMSTDASNAECKMQYWWFYDRSKKATIAYLYADLFDLYDAFVVFNDIHLQFDAINIVLFANSLFFCFFFVFFFFGRLTCY